MLAHDRKIDQVGLIMNKMGVNKLPVWLEYTRSELDISSLERFGSKLDAQWIREALEKTGTATVRRRRIEAERVIWLAIAMALFRDRSIQEVVEHLDLVLPKSSGGTAGGKLPVRSAVTQARYRVGAKPMQVLFERTGKHFAEKSAREHLWRGLSVYGMDGTTLRIQDTPQNEQRFGRPGSSRGQAGYPQVRAVTLMALRTHVIHSASFGPYRGKQTGELSLAEPLWSQVPNDSVLILDKGFLNHGALYRYSNSETDGKTQNRHWLIRGKKNTKFHNIQKIGPGDYLAELAISKKDRDKDKSLPKRMLVRVIAYRFQGGEQQTLITSLLDRSAYPSKDLLNLYHERWDIELGYDEIKTHMLERQESLRSKKPEGVEQEIFGIFLAYNLVRVEMVEVATSAGVTPQRVSFRHSLQLIRKFCMIDAWLMAPGNLPKRYHSYHNEISSLLVLPPRRTKRRYPRHVKIKMSNYKRNPGRVVTSRNTKEMSLN